MSGLGYTLPAVLAAAAVCWWELARLRTGLFRKPTYWISIAIMFAFQIPVDGWLTKSDSPIVVYAPEHITGIRFPWDIPVEDFVFGFAVITLTLLLRQRYVRAHEAGREGEERAAS